MTNPVIKSVPADKIQLEDGVMELVNSEKMKPYMAIIQALDNGEDAATQLVELANVPFEDRYSWRIMSALRLAFYDFDSSSIRADLQTLSEERKKKLFEPIELRAMQFCKFIVTLYGKENGKQFILWALDTVTAEPEANSTQ